MMSKGAPEKHAHVEEEVAEEGALHRLVPLGLPAPLKKGPRSTHLPALGAAAADWRLRLHKGVPCQMP